MATITDGGNKCQQQHGPSTPLVTVSGDLTDYLLEGHLSQQMTGDLARESIDWLRSKFDITPVPVYVEAQFVRLDERCHWLWNTNFTQKLFPHHQPAEPPNRASHNQNHKTQSPPPLSAPAMPSQSAASLRRHHSFNVNQNQVPPSPSAAIGSRWSSTRSPQRTRFGSDFQNLSASLSSATVATGASMDIDYSELFKVIGQRYLWNNGARVLLNSYWLDASHDMESYNARIRDDLLEWFQKMLTVTAAQHRLGLNLEFEIDFFIVIVIRTNRITPLQASTSPNAMIRPPAKQQEQLLNLSNLESQHRRENRFPLPAKMAKGKPGKNSLSSSMSSLNSSLTATGTTAIASNLNPFQLADQIRNDLLVQFQLFRQDFLTHGHPITAASIPVNNNRIASQLLERVIIFDSTSNSSQSETPLTLPLNNHHSNSLASSRSSTNPLISSTARTFSALSHFSASSIKINPMSPTKVRKTSNLSTSGSSSSAVVLPSGGGGSGSASSGSVLSLNYTQFIIRVRAFLLEFYTRQFECFERLIRAARELRQDPEWDYFGFFLLQEELAFGYESLGLYSQSLVQYDELDALFSQSIQAGSSGFGGPRWLRARLMDDDEQQSGRRHNVATWNGLCLCGPGAIFASRLKIVNAVLATGSDASDEESKPGRTNISCEFEDPLGVSGGGGGPVSISEESAMDGRINVLDFRNYLYARQCHLLCLLNKPWELASRALPFLQNAVAELNMLEINITSGGVACWVFLSALEILHKCERYSDSSQLDSYSYHTVGLWSYARENLIELGQLCNLMPPSESSGSGEAGEITLNLHRVVELIAGMGADPHVRPSVLTADDQTWMSPQERLKDALSSPEAFIRHYLEITELTMGTYKHIGHIRCARFIGKQLAQLYLKLNRPQQALPFLLDLYHMFQTEHWLPLKREACRLLALCLEQLVFQVSNNLTAPDATAISLEPIIRSAVRTILLLFVLFTGDSVSVLDDNQQYLDSMRRLLRHYEKKGVLLREVLAASDSIAAEDGQDKIDLDRPLLTIHNRHSDLLHDGPGPTASTVSLSTNSSSNSDSNLPATTGGDQQETRHRLRNQPSMMIGSNEYIGPNRPLDSSGSGGDNLFRVESLDIRCCTADNACLSGSNEKISSSPDQSFIAGSLLSLQMRIQSELRLPLVVERVVVTLECQTDMVPLPSSLSEFDSGECSRCCAAEAQLESHRNPSGVGVGIRCLNVNRVLKRSHDGVHRFLTQLPISLLNQRLSNEDYHRYFRFLSAKFRFEVDDQRPLARDSEFELRFQSPANLETAVCQKNRSLNHVWFRLDQMVLFCRYRQNEEDLRFAILDDFRAPVAFRLVKCPPSVELMPRNLNHSAQSFIGIEEPVVLRLNSGTSTLPEGLRCTVKISQVNSEIIVGGGGTDSIGSNLSGTTTIMASLHQGTTTADDDTELVEFHLEHLLEPFQTYELDLVLRSQYAKPKTVAIHGNQRLAPKNQENSDPTFEFRLSLAWQEEISGEETPPPPSSRETMATCHFILCDPFHLLPRIHTAGPERKLLQIHLSPSNRLPPFGLELWFRFPRVEIAESAGSGGQWLEPLGPADPAGSGWHRLTAQNKLSFLWLYRPATTATMNLNLEFVAGSPPPPPPVEDHTVNVIYQIRVLYDVRTRYTIRQWIEPLLKPGVVKNSEIIRIGNSCLFRVKIDRVSDQQQEDDEFLMYELVCDPDLWAFVSSYRAIEAPECDSEESSSVSPEEAPGDGAVSLPAALPQPSGAESMVIKFSRGDDRVGFETCFEVMPLTPGHIPLPTVRISLYVPNDPGTETTSMPATFGAGAAKTPKPSSAIESLSAKLSENLSLSGKTWSKYLSPGGTKLPPTETESFGTGANHQRTARLKPFEPGQVYNYNRSSQVYVLPSVTAIGPD